MLVFSFVLCVHTISMVLLTKLYTRAHTRAHTHRKPFSELEEDKQHAIGVQAAAALGEQVWDGNSDD